MVIRRMIRIIRVMVVITLMMTMMMTMTMTMMMMVGGVVVVKIANMAF